MPKERNNRAGIGSKLARRANQIDLKRAELLENILIESSSSALNDGTNQQSPRQALESHSRLLQLIDELRQLEANLNPKLPSRTDQSWKRFFGWLDNELGTNGHLKLSEKVGITNQSPACGEGNLVGTHECALVAKIPFKSGDHIFEIDRLIMLSTETASKDADLFEFIKRDSIASAMQNVVLVLHLLNEYSKGDKSYWSPYLAILPNKRLPILRCNKDELNYLLASAHIFEALKMIRAIARQYSYFFKRLQSTNLPVSRDFTFEYYSWGVSIVCSRQNEIPPLERKNCSLPVIHALIPILDMCNHDRSSNQAQFEDNQSRLVAPKEIKIGDEVTINYGCRSSGDFYIHNGFVPEEVPFDVVPLTIALSRETPSFESKVKLLKTLNMPTFGRFRLTLNDHENRHKRDPHLTMFLIVYFLSDKELEFILNNENPVGIADEIYEYVHYKDCAAAGNNVDPSEQSVNTNEGESKLEIAKMKERLGNYIKAYLSKRATIGIALIDRTLTGNESIDFQASLLLKHEKSIYESYLIKSSAS